MDLNAAERRREELELPSERFRRRGRVILPDRVFSIDSIFTAVGMTNNSAVVVIAVLVAVGTMLLAADLVAESTARNPMVVLAVGSLLMIGVVLIADGFGEDGPKGNILAVMAFSTLADGLNIVSGRATRSLDSD